MNIKTFMATAVAALTLAACAAEEPAPAPAGADEAPREQGPHAPESK